MVFLVCKRLRGANDNRVARVYADGVDIFHITNGDCGVCRVTDNLVFDFFITLDALFDKYLMNGGKGQRIFDKLRKFLSVFGKAAACTA